MKCFECVLVDSDFESCLLSLFMPRGRMCAIFTDSRLGVLPDPEDVAESFDVAATAFVPINMLMVSCRKSDSPRRSANH
jgi:hypothetical protein